MKATQNPNERVARERLCEAAFDAGSKRLIEGDREKAVDLFTQCLETGANTFSEFRSATAELQALRIDK